MHDDTQFAGSLTRRSLLGMGIAGGAGLALGGAGLFGGLSQAVAAPAVDQPWRTYPFSLWPGDRRFDFPAAEGRFDNCGSDTWFASGKLVGTESGRHYAFIVIYCKNRIVGTHADFHTFALFDMETGEYGTSTEIDFPPTNLTQQPRLTMAAGSLDLAFRSDIGVSRWSTRRSGNGRLIPFSYDTHFRGRDQRGRHMALDVSMDPQRRPSSVSSHGLMTCFGQPDTGSYFQTRPSFSGTVSWRGITETVTGSVGHIDRQWFPQYAGVAVGITQRDRSHEWRALNLDDGTDLSIWRQFDRRRRNAISDFTGGAAINTHDVTTYAGDIEVEYLDYERWPDAVATFVPPLSTNRYVATAHTLRVPSWGLEATATPLSRVPAHGLPVEYAIGPVSYEGTFRGRPMSAFGISERTLILYRDWELAGVLRTVVAGLPASRAHATLRREVDDATRLVERGARIPGARALTEKVTPLVRRLDHPRRAFLLRLISDTVTAPS